MRRESINVALVVLGGLGTGAGTSSGRWWLRRGTRASIPQDSGNRQPLIPNRLVELGEHAKVPAGHWGYLVQRLPDWARGSGGGLGNQWSGMDRRGGLEMASAQGFEQNGIDALTGRREG